MEREKTCCFTGHRPDKLPWGTDESDPRCLALKARLEAEAAALTQARLAQVSGTKPGGRKPLHALRIQKRSQTQ